MQTVALIDYRSGNIRSAENALVEAARRGSGEQAVRLTADPEVIVAADRIVLPGVGAFRACMDALDARDGVVEAMTEAVHRRGTPFLGVCVGMQLLASRGREFGVREGLGWIPGEVRRLAPDDPHAKVPHMGWNDIHSAEHPLFAGPGGSPAMYFTHSFAFHPDEAAAVIATADHGGPVVAAVAKDNIAGMQFHPEKSQAAGLALIGRFLEWRP